MGANAHVARVLTARVSFEDLCVLISFAYVDGGGRTNALPFVRARGAKMFRSRLKRFCDFCFFT